MVDDADLFIYEAFWDLNSCRRFAEGPIPWSDIVGYCKYKEFDSELTEYLIEAIRYLDKVARDWIKVNRKKTDG